MDLNTLTFILFSVLSYLFLRELDMPFWVFLICILIGFGIERGVLFLLGF